MTSNVSWGQLFTLAVAAVAVAFSTTISVMIQKDMLDLETFMQVFGFVGALFGTGAGGYVAGKRSGAGNV
jgi:hypothetical protein